VTRRRRTTLAQALALVLGVTALAQLAAGAWLYGRLRERLERDLGRRLGHVAALIAQGLDATLVTQFRSGDERLAAYALMRERLAAQAAAAGVARAWVADAELLTLLDSAPEQLPGRRRHALLAQASEARAALAGRVQATRLWRAESGELRLSALAPLRARDGRVQGLVGVEAAQEYFEGLALLRRESLLLGGVGFALAALAGAVALRQVGARLERLRQVVAGAARGDLRVRPEPAGDDPIGALGRDLDGLIAASLTQRDLYEGVLADLDVAVLAADANGRVWLANPALWRLLGAGPEDGAGRPLEALLAPAPELSAAAREVGANGVARALRVAWRGGPAAGGRALHAALSSLRSGQGPAGVIVSLLDVTAFEELQRRAHANERLAGLGRLAGGLLHEIGNPLAAVALYLDLLQPLLPAGEAADLGARAQVEARRVQEFLEDFRVFAGLRPLRLELVELRALAERAGAGVAWPAGVDVRLTDDGARARCDARLIVHAVRNLLRNAAEALAGRTGRVELTCGHAGGDAFVSVRDDGPGLDAVDAERVREPLYTTKPHGTGLGLALVERAAEVHRGTLRVESPRGGGACFTLRWPAGE
jgi:signal transduction histidine kinase